MSLAQDLMGLGESPLMAARVASGGTGPVTMTSAGTSQATAAVVNGAQYVTSITALGASGGCITFASPTGANPPLIADDYVLHNATTGSMTVFAPVGTTINIGGAAYAGANPFTLATLKTLTIWTAPTTTQWFGLSA